MHWNIADKARTRWLNICHAASKYDSVFACFRRTPHVSYITANWPQSSVASCWQCATTLVPALRNHLPALASTDTVGGPEPTACDFVEGWPVSSCLARSLLRAAQIEHLFGPLAGMHIAEIGGGYGSLARVLMAVHGPASYTLFDLPAPAELQQRFLAVHGLTPVFPALGAIALETYDLAISECSLSELDGPTQQHYFDTVLRRSQRGFHFWNWTRDDWPVEVTIEADLARLNAALAPQRVHYYARLNFGEQQHAAASLGGNCYVWGCKDGFT